MFNFGFLSELWITLIVVSFFGLYPLVFKSGAPKGQLKGRRVLGIFAVFMAGFSFVLCIDWFNGDFAEEDFYYLVFLVSVLFAGALYLFGEAFFVAGEYDDNSIVFRTPWSGEKRGQWSSLTSIKFSTSSSWYILKFEDGTKMRVSTFLHGYPDLMLHLKSLDVEIE